MLDPYCTFSMHFGPVWPVQPDQQPESENSRPQSAKPLPKLVITMFVYLLPVPSEDCTALLNRKNTLKEEIRNTFQSAPRTTHTVPSYFHNGILTGASRLNEVHVVLINTLAQEQISASLTYREKQRILAVSISQSESQAQTRVRDKTVVRWVWGGTIQFGEKKCGKLAFYF